MQQQQLVLLFNLRKIYIAERKLLELSGEHRGDICSSDSPFEGSRTQQWNTEAPWWQKKEFINHRLPCGGNILLSN